MLDLIEHGNILEELSIKNDDCPGGEIGRRARLRI